MVPFATSTNSKLHSVEAEVLASALALHQNRVIGKIVFDCHTEATFRHVEQRDSKADVPVAHKHQLHRS